MDETVKKFWDDRPCNIKHSDKPIGTKEYFEEVTTRKYKVEPHILAFANFPEWKDKDVLEVGCGIGTAAQSFTEHGARYTGIDVSERSIELARKRLDLFGLPGDVQVQDIQSWRSGKKYDLIYSFGVLHHIRDLPSALENIRTMLKPGGVFKMMMYAENSWKKMCIDAGLDQYEAQSGVPIANTYTHEEIRDLVKDFGGEVTIEQDHIFQWNVDEYKKYNYVREPWFEAMPPELVRALETRFGWHLMITIRKCSSL